MNNQDTFNIICTFLNPIQLIKFRFLSINHNKWTKLYLIKNFKNINIEYYVCPKCANWLDNKEDISNYTEFNDYFLTDEIKTLRFQSIEDLINSKYIGVNTERSKVLCDDCECNEDYSNSVFQNFKYKGSREYNIIYFYSLHSWVALYLKNKDTVLWNEYKKPISICYKEYTVSENSNDFNYNYYNDTYDNYDNYDNEEYDTYDNYDNEEYDTYDNYDNEEYNEYNEE
jgi:uncharacterized protein YlaI